MADSSETLERRFRRVYSQAHKELTAELNAYIARYRKEERLMKERLAKKQITPEEYESWLRRKVFQGKQWRGKVNQMASTLANSNQAALDIIRGYQMNVFADGANREAFEIERMTKGGKIDADMGIDFTLYNADTVERLIAEEPELLPRKQLATGKDKAWNQKKIANAVTQGIIQGNSIDEIAKRIAKNTASDDMKAMTRYARTAVTSAQNAGRMETMHRAQEMGITVQKQWLATLDKRTRDSHRHLDGQVQELNKPFKSDFGEIMYPGDPTAAPGDVYNCRCTLVSVYPQYNSVIQPGERFERLEGESYEEWKEGKRKQNPDVTPTSLREELTGNRQAVNIWGEAINYDAIKDQKGREEQISTVEELTNEFNTKLKEVRLGAHQAGGTAQISGTVINLSNKSIDTAVHEFAHTITQIKQTEFGLYDESEFWKELKKIQRAYRKEMGNNPDFSRVISSYEYGDRSPDEFFAEAFTHAYCHEKGIPTQEGHYGTDYTYSDQVLALARKYFGKGTQGEISQLESKVESAIQRETKEKKQEPKKDEFVPAKTIDEAEVFAKTFANTNMWASFGISYKGVSVETANAVNRTLSTLFRTYNVEPLSGIVAPTKSSKLGRMVEGAHAGFIPMNRGMVLNRESLKTPKLFAERQKREAEMVKKYLDNPAGFKVTSKAAKLILDASAKSGRSVVAENIEEAITHEFGHALEKALRKLPNYGTVMKSRGKFGELISGYATESDAEYIAESFCSWNKGEKNVDPDLIELFKMLMR